MKSAKWNCFSMLRHLFFFSQSSSVLQGETYNCRRNWEKPNNCSLRNVSVLKHFYTTASFTAWFLIMLLVLLYFTAWHFHICRSLDIPEAAKAVAQEKDFELKGYVFEAAPENLRDSRIVRIAGIQNKIVLPTTVPIHQQVWIDDACYFFLGVNSVIDTAYKFCNKLLTLFDLFFSFIVAKHVI